MYTKILLLYNNIYFTAAAAFAWQPAGPLRTTSTASESKTFKIYTLFDIMAYFRLFVVWYMNGNK